MRHSLTHLLRGGIVAMLLAVAALGGTAEARGAVVPRNPVAIMSEPTYSDKGTELTMTLWMYNYDGDNANYRGDVWLMVDGKQTLKLNSIWSLISNITNEDDIKGKAVSGNVGSQGSMAMDGLAVGTAQFCNLRKDQKSSDNANKDEKKWSVVDLKLSFNSSFPYRAHTINVKGTWRDWCDDKNQKDAEKIVGGGISGFLFPQNLSAEMLSYTATEKIRFSWSVNTLGYGRPGSWVIYKMSNSVKTKVGSEYKPSTYSDMECRDFDCNATYYVTFLPDNFTEGDTICGLTAAYTPSGHMKLKNDVCQVCGHMLFRYRTTDGNTANVKGNFGANMVSHGVVDGECVIEFDKPITTIPQKAFYNTKITGTLNIPNSVTTIEEAAFYDCSGLSGQLVIPNSVTKIGISAFSRCSGLSGQLVIPNSVTEIGNSAFSRCSGLSGQLVIPNSVTFIGTMAFYGCSGLSGQLVIPNSVKYIDFDAFYDCSGLSEIEFRSLPDNVGKRIYGGRRTLRLDDASYVGSRGIKGSYFAEASYERTMANEWGTLVLPFAVSLTGSEAYGLYSVENATADELVLRRLTGTVGAGTPCIVRRIKDGGNIRIEVSGASPTPDLLASPAGPLTLTGTYATQDVADGYIIASDRFWSVGELLAGTSTKGVRVAPFRAWLTGSVSGAAQLSMRVPGEATGIEAVEAGDTDWLNDPANEYYDLGGRRTDGLRTGVNIVRTKSGATRKVVVR